MTTQTVEISARDMFRPVRRLHKKCVGSCHAYLTLREDFREHVRSIQREVGFEMIRFHGIFHDFVGTCGRDSSGALSFNFRNSDKIYDFFLSQGIKPFVELGFMPECLASGGRTIFAYKANVTPPKDYAEWAALIKAFVSHLIDRYGINEVLSWKFEVWNEPDLKDAFWTGDQAEYFKLYKTTARAIKSIDPRLKVGGPATSKSLWIKDTLDFCASESVPIDFVSTHHYCADAALVEGKDIYTPIQYRGQKAMLEDAKRTVAAVRSSRFPKAEVHYTEWNVSPCHEDVFGKDSEFTATFALQTLNDMDGVLDSYSLWTVSDIFEESGPGSMPFSGKYGLVSVDGIRKPIFHAYKFLSMLHPLQHASKSSSVISTEDGGGSHRLLTWNHNEPESWDFTGKDWRIKESLKEERIVIRNVSGRYRIKGFGVGPDCGNALRSWRQMGSPQYLSPQQARELSLASEPSVCADQIVECDGALELKHTLAPCSFMLYDVARL